MKLLNEIQKIFDNYELKPIELPEGYKNVYQYRRDFPDDKKFESEKDDGYFINKYNKYIPRGWYGFSLGNPIVPEWCEIIDKTVEICIANDPKFEIHQIKLKLGYICVQCESQVIDDINEIEIFIMNNFFDPKLIY